MHFGHFDERMEWGIPMMAAYADTSFRPLGVVDEPIQRKAKSVARTGYLVYAGENGFEAALPKVVAERMVLLGRQAAPQEWYGLLVGHLYVDDDGEHVVIVGVVPDPEADASRGFVQTSFESELRTRMSARLLFPDGIPIGWVHGHVRYGARYSSTDFRNQATWTRSHSIGIVVDPFCEPKLGVYRGPEGELLKLVPTEATAAPPVGPAMDVKAAPSEPIPSATVPRRIYVWSFVSSIAAMAAIAAVTILWARVGRLHEAAAGLERRGERIELTQQESPVLRLIPPPVGAGEMSQPDLVGTDETASMCVGP
jgi:proteasome lid subunit RPN8/RPN11